MKSKWLNLIAVTVILFGYTNCSQSEFSVQSSISNTDGGGGSEVGNPMIPLSVQAFAPPSAGFAVRFCLSEIKVSNPSAQIVSFLVGPLVVNVNSAGFSLPDIPLANGNYDSVILRLTNQCLPATQSLEVTNASGSFSDTVAFFDIVFRGNITIDATTRRFDLNMQPIIDQLGTITSNAEVIPRATAQTGTY